MDELDVDPIIMKPFVHSIFLIAVLANKALAFDYFPLLADQPKTPEAISASIASSSQFYLRHLDVPERLSSVRAFIAIYRAGVSEPDGQGGAAMNGSSEMRRKLAVSVAVRPHEAPKHIPGKGCPDGVVPGTGSTHIGMSFLSYSPDGTGSSGGGSQIVIEHGSIDMMKMSGPLDPTKLPFVIETRATREQHAVPVFVWLPLSFDPTKSAKKLTAKDLPDGTIIVYAVINEDG